MIAQDLMSAFNTKLFTEHLALQGSVTLSLLLLLQQAIKLSSRKLMYGNPNILTIVSP